MPTIEIVSHSDWKHEVPQCNRCSGMVAVDQNGIVHHEGTLQTPYGIPCTFEGTKEEWLNHLACTIPCSFCNTLPELVDNGRLIAHHNPNNKNDFFVGNPRAWLRRVTSMKSGDHPLTKKQ